MFQLHIADQNLESGSVAVSWQLDQKLLEEFAKKGVTDPQVVIVVAPSKNYHISRESRKVVPLKDMMAYLECRSSGKNKIYGTISFLSPSEARERYLSKVGGEFSHNILDYDGETYGHYHLRQENDYSFSGILPVRKKYNYLSNPLDITVPKEAFAKDPPKWEKTWVNLFFRQKVVDQCDYRRRRLFAYLVQPFIMLFNFIVRTVILTVGLSTGARGLSLKYFNLIIYSWKDSIDIWREGSYFIRKLKEDEDNEVFDYLPVGYAIRSLWTVPFMPALVIPALLFWRAGHGMVPLIVLASAIGLLLFLCGLTYITVKGNARNLVDKVWSAITWVIRPLRNADGSPWYLSQDNMQLITDNKSDLNYQKLKRKTMRLRFQNLKTKVCRPFSA